MKDEFEFLERLFLHTYEHQIPEMYLNIEFIDKDISEELVCEFDSLKRAYFGIAGQGGSNEEIQSKFIFRAKRLLHFKTRLEEYLKDAVNELVLPNESYSLVYYKNLMCAYAGVVDLLKFMPERLFVSLEDALGVESLIMKYNGVDADQVKEWQEEFKKNYSFGDEYVLVDGITIDTRTYSHDLKFPLNLEYKKRILQKVNGDLLEGFDKLIMHVRNMIHLTSKDSEEQKILYQGLSETFNKILKKKDRFEREQEALNLLIETNLVPDVIIKYTIEYLDKELLDKNENGRKEILVAFRKRLYKLKESPTYSNYHLSTIKKLDKVTLDELIGHVESQLENYDSLLLENADRSNSLGTISTNLTVAEISLLFKLLADKKIIKADNVSKLSKQIALIFSSKQKDKISDVTVRNHFDTPQNEAINFWDEKLQGIMAKLKKY